MKKRDFPKEKDRLRIWALYYLSLGWCVLPIKKGAKEPSVRWKAYQEKLPTEKQVKAWWTQFPKANIAVLAGKVSGLYMLDVDSDQGRQEIETLSGDNPMPWTPTVKTARGEHIYFRSEKLHKYHKAQGWELIGDKHYIIAPPSVHKTGKIYKWGNLQTPEFPIAPLPTWLQDALNNQKRPERDFEIDQKLQDLLKTYWEKEGQRHTLALGLSGYLYSLSWPKAMVRHLFEKVCSLVNDEEVQERIDTLDNTYEKGEQGEQVTGYDTLRGIFVGTELDRLEELARGRHIPLKMRQIDNIRKQPKTPKWLTDRRIGEKIKGYFREKGRFLKVEGNRCYYFNTLTKQVLSLFCPEMETVLDLEFGINPADQLMNAIQKTLRSETLRYGKDVKVYLFAHFEPDKHLLYIYAGNGIMYRLDGKRIESVNNGTDNVYFEEISRDSWWKADFENLLNPYEVLVKDLSFDTGKGVALEADLQKKVFWLWLRTLFFEEIQPTKPILTLTGDRGSGKTTALRRVLKLLFGEEANVKDLRDEAAWTPALTTNYLLGIDNVDRRVRWLPGKLDVAATGQRISVRRLYVTNVEESYKVRCFIAMTSLDPPFSEGTTASRMLILRMRPLEKIVPENLLTRNVLKQRNQFWAGLLNQLNKDVELEKGKYVQTTFRMADFAALGAKFSMAEPNGVKGFEQIIKGLEEEQKAQILSKSVVPGYIEKDFFNPEHGYTVAELFAKWKVLADDENLGFSFRSVEILGRELVNVRGDLLKEYGIAWRRDHNRQVYFFPKTVHKQSPHEKEKEHKKQAERLFEEQEEMIRRKRKRGEE